MCRWHDICPCIVDVFRYWDSYVTWPYAGHSGRGEKTMRRTIMTTILLFLVIAGFHATIVTADNSRTLVVQLKGRDTGETRTIPPVANTGTREGNCFDM